MNVFLSGIVATKKTPLYPRSSSPSVFSTLLIFLNLTTSPIVKLCGNSVVIVAVVPTISALAINLGFLSSVLSLRTLDEIL